MCEQPAVLQNELHSPAVKSEQFFYLGRIDNMTIYMAHEIYLH